MKALLRRLWFRRRLAAGAGSFYAEAQCAGWGVPPVGVDGLPTPASAPGKDKVEADGLLARFYSSQEC
jgi:hypothetical protein